jgi:hypothetical protein
MGNTRAIVIASLAALPMAALEVWSLGMVLTEFSRGGADVRALVFLVLVQGGILTAIVLGVMGAVRRRPGTSVLGAGLMFLEGVPLIFSFAWLAVLVSGLFLLAARDTAPIRGASLVGARVIGSLAALWAAACVPSMLRGPPLFLVFLVVALCGVVAVSWWPPVGQALPPVNPSESSDGALP